MRTEGQQEEGILKPNHPGTHCIREEVRPQPWASTHCLGPQQPFPHHPTSVSLSSPAQLPGFGKETRSWDLRTTASPARDYRRSASPNRWAKVQS